MSHTQTLADKTTQIMKLLDHCLMLPAMEINVAAMKMFVYPCLKYVLPFWRPHNPYKLEIAQRTTARWTCRRWLNITHVGKMVQQQQRSTLGHRYINASFLLFIPKQ